MPSRTLLLLILSATPFLAHAEEGGEIASPNATIAPVEPMAVQESAPAANSETFAMKGNSEADQSDCKARVQAYLDKQACMNRYRGAPVRTTRDGSPITSSTDPAKIVYRSPIRPEAFEKCGADVKYPVDCPIQ